MRHEKIIKRERGGSVRIFVYFNESIMSFGNDGSYSVLVQIKGYRKKNWKNVVDSDDWEYRKLDSRKRERYIREKILEVCTLDEIHAAMLELWEKLKPLRPDEPFQLRQ